MGRLDGTGCVDSRGWFETLFMKKYWWLIALVVALASGVGGVVGLNMWRAHVRKAADDRGFKRAEQALAERRPAEALALFQAVDRSESPHPWPKIEIAALAGLGQMSRLVTIFEKDRPRILENEDASLLMARVFLHSRQKEKLDLVMTGHKSESPAWGMLQADALLLDGKSKEARKLLESKKYDGTNDVQRMVRLALLSDLRSPTNAWNILADAAALDPRNPDVRSFRGQLLESIGKTGLARVEYVAALVASQDPLRRDQLAEFYRRQGSFDLAMSTWNDGLKTNSFDFMWLKSGFWAHIASGSREASSLGVVPGGTLSGLAREVLALKPGQFWSDGLATELAAHQQAVNGRQEVFWLQLADMLSNGRERDAREKLQFAKSSAYGWAPDLARNLSQILAWRQTTNRNLNPSGMPFAESSTNQHSFVVRLEELSRQERSGGGTKALPEDLESVVTGTHAFAAAFLAEGWREAAITVADPAKLSPNAPEWLSYGLAQALRYNRGLDAALAFVATRPSTPLLQMLASEIQMGLGQTNEAYAGLEKLRTVDSEIGVRAAWLLATAAMERRDFAGVRTFVDGQAGLKSTVLGKELLARAALSEGKPSEAEALYRGIEQDSVEARAYLARKAYSEKNWKVARKYTQELLAIMPDQLELRSNMDAIAAAESAP